MGQREGRHHAWVPVLLVLAMLGGAAAVWRLDLVDRWFAAESPDPLTEPAAVSPPEGIDVPELPEPGPVAEPAEGGRLVVGAVRRALTYGLADRDLGRSVHAAVAPLTGRPGPAYDVGDGSFAPASTLKLLTTTAALAVLGPDHRFVTRVLTRGRTLTLVGGGDPLLQRAPGQPDQFPVRADMLTLARETAAVLRRLGTAERPVRLAYDDSLFSGPAANPHWRADYVSDDIVSPIGALWVDEGIAASGFERVEDPAADAATTFATALGKQGVRVMGSPVAGRAPAGARELARVSSASLSQIVELVLEVSDNEGAEVLARHVGLAVADDGSFAGGVEGVRQTLAGLGVPLAGAVILDGSGLSRDNRLRADTLIEVLRAAADPDHPELRAVLSGLPVGGFTGSLVVRFDDAVPAGVGRVRAKTGSLTGIRSLTGIAVDRTGTPLAFVLAADRLRLVDTLDAQQELDNLAALLGACRCSR